MVQTVRLTRDNHHYEILTNDGSAMAYRKGEETDVSSVLAIDHVFSDTGLGTKVSKQGLQTAFGTDNLFKVAEVILKEGHVLLNEKERKHALDDQSRGKIRLDTKNLS